MTSSCQVQTDAALSTNSSPEDSSEPVSDERAALEVERTAKSRSPQQGAGKAPQVEVYGVILHGRGNYNARADLKELGADYDEVTKDWFFYPVDPSRSWKVQGKVEHLRDAKGVELTWLGGPDLPREDLVELRDGLLNLSRKDSYDAARAVEIMTGHVQRFGREPAWDVQDPSPRACYIGSLKGRKLFVTLPGVAAEAGRANPAPAENPTLEDPWKNSRWIRLNMPVFTDRFYTPGVRENAFGAAHFKVFLALIQHMDEWNMVYETQGELAKEAKVKPSRVCEVLDDLEKVQCIQRLYQGMKKSRIRVSPHLLIGVGGPRHHKLLKDWNDWPVLKEEWKAGLKPPVKRRNSPKLPLRQPTEAEETA